MLSTVYTYYTCVYCFFAVSCPIRGQYYSVGGCHAVDATCDNRDPPFLCDASLCVCPDGQVVSPDGSRCINVTECRKLSTLTE